jgi:hypothetical protein
MKYIKKIDELYKSTLLSAHNKLKYKHPHRANKLKKWADESGKSDLSKLDIDRIFPYGFALHDNASVNDIKNDFLSTFYIIGIESVENDSYLYITVCMMNDYGQNIKLVVKLYARDYSIHEFYVKWGRENERQFLFERRKDAVQFRKFILEDGLSELGMDNRKDIISKVLVINRLYTTINDKKDL